MHGECLRECRREREIGFIRKNKEIGERSRNGVEFRLEWIIEGKREWCYEWLR